MNALIPNVSVPEGTSGAWRVEQFTVTQQEAKFGALRAAVAGTGRYVPAGTYTRLIRGSTCVMSDTPDEKRDHYRFVWSAKGHVLINGLGLGMVLGAVLQNPAVTKATVVEISPDVIALVAPSYRDPRVSIVCGDALTIEIEKGAKFGAVWHDIWDNICADNLEAMKTLHRRYGRRAEWQGSWARHLCERWS